MHTFYWIVGVMAFAIVCALFSGPSKAMEESYDGLLDSAYAQSLPQAYVVYPPSEEWPHESRSMSMPVGNARDYAKIFGGTVVRVK